jgi:terminase, large subunit
MTDSEIDGGVPVPDLDLAHHGMDFLCGLIDGLTETVPHLTPVEYNQNARYIPRSVSRFSGYLDLELTPYWIEILNCMDIFSPVREVAVKKGVQVGYNTLGVESPLFYAAGHLKVFPCMFATADATLANEKIEHCILPMFQQSGLDIFQSADLDNSRKTGKTKNHLQWKGGGYCIPVGGKNADKLRSWSVMFLFMDEIDTFVQSIGRDGDPISLLKDRCTAFWDARKIIMGSTPLIKGSSHIDRQFHRGDQREYRVRCLGCGHPQAIRFSGTREDGSKHGFKWETGPGGMLEEESVRWHCVKCDHAHQEADKPRLISSVNAEWVPTAEPVAPGIRSYHLPATLSRVQPWAKCVSQFLEAYGPGGVLLSVEKLQVFYNNVLGESFEVVGEKFTFQRMSAHRRTFYRYGQIPNREIEKYCPSVVQFLAMTVDVHADFLAVLVMGFTVGGNGWTIEYKHITDPVEHGCELIESPCWAEVQRMIDEQEYVADDGKRYRIAITLVDSGYAEKTVSEFCSQWDSGVYPIKGDSYSDKRINNFREMKTSAGANGFLIAADAYKDRMAPILRREWQPEMGDQGQYQFNAPVDMTDLQVKELTREYKREKKMPNGNVKREWYRPHGARQELWDCLMYAEAAYEILALLVCRNNLELPDIDWPTFWAYAEEQQLFFSLD